MFTHKSQLHDLLDTYWAAAYAEGKYHRDTDTPEGTAQTALDDILGLFSDTRRTERRTTIEMCAKICEEQKDPWASIDDCARAIRALKDIV